MSHQQGSPPCDEHPPKIPLIVLPFFSETTAYNDSSELPLSPPLASGAVTMEGQRVGCHEQLSTTIANQVVDALQTSGFLLIQPHPKQLPQDLLASVLEITNDVLTSNRPTLAASSKQEEIGKTKSTLQQSVIDHPTDPKRYLMFESLEDMSHKILSRSDVTSNTATTSQRKHDILRQYWLALEAIKRQLLRYVAIGLLGEGGIDEQEYFVKLHSQNQSVLRLLHYPGYDGSSGASDAIGGIKGDDGKDCQELRIRGKAHSDYGSLTLLLHDGVPGLQAWVDEEWIDVPYIPGTLVVNIGSLLQDWTQGQLLATLHRVVATAPIESNDNERKIPPRTSIAFFADPNPDVMVALQSTCTSTCTDQQQNYKNDNSSSMSVQEYILWRSGGKELTRSGVAFSNNEMDRAPLDEESSSSPP